MWRLPVSTMTVSPGRTLPNSGALMASAALNVSAVQATRGKLKEHASPSQKFGRTRGRCRRPVSDRSGAPTESVVATRAMARRLDDAVSDATSRIDVSAVLASRDSPHEATHGTTTAITIGKT